MMIRLNALISLAVLAAGHTAAFQQPNQPNTNKPKASLGVSFVEPPADFFAPVAKKKAVLEPDPISDREKRARASKESGNGAGFFQSASMRKFAESAAAASQSKIIETRTQPSAAVKRAPLRSASTTASMKPSTESSVVQTESPAAAASQEEQSSELIQKMSTAMEQEQVVAASSALESTVVQTKSPTAVVSQKEQSPELTQKMPPSFMEEKQSSELIQTMSTESSALAPYEKQEQSVTSAIENLDLSKISNVFTPAEAFEALADKGKYNAESKTSRILFSSALGGCYVGMGAMVSLAVAGNSPDLAAADPGLYKFLFAALFPMNLLLAQQCGGMLYTGNTANMMAAVCEKRATFKDMARVCGLSWVGNLAGCSGFAIACKYAGVLDGGAGLLAAQTLATKTGYEFGPLFVKALFCNWLVCLAVLLSTQAKDMGGKYISIWLPVSTFVSIGFEHSVANMFLLPAGLMSQDKITIQTALFHNLLPVTVGNAFSGALLVGATMSYLFGSLGKEEGRVSELWFELFDSLDKDNEEGKEKPTV